MDRQVTEVVGVLSNPQGGKEDWQMINIYAGNLSYQLTEPELREAFEQYGSVSACSLISDRLTGRSRGFGFVEMPNDDEGKAAIEKLHDVELKGRKLLIREARPKGERSAAAE